jgi:hypothetical protein
MQTREQADLGALVSNRLGVGATGTTSRLFFEGNGCSGSFMSPPDGAFQPSRQRWSKPAITPGSGSVKLPVIFILIGLVACIALLNACPNQLRKTNAGVTLRITSGLDAGSLAVPYTSGLPKGWPEDFIPPPNSLISEKYQQCNIMPLYVKSDWESVATYCTQECERLGIPVTRHDFTSKIENHILLQLQYNSKTMYITIYSSGIGFTTDPITELGKYVKVRLAAD